MGKTEVWLRKWNANTKLYLFYTRIGLDGVRKKATEMTEVRSKKKSVLEKSCAFHTHVFLPVQDVFFLFLCWCSCSLVLLQPSAGETQNYMVLCPDVSIASHQTVETLWYIKALVIYVLAINSSWLDSCFSCWQIKCKFHMCIWAKCQKMETEPSRKHTISHITMIKSIPFCLFLLLVLWV